MQRVVDRFAQREHMKGIAVYEADGSALAMTSTLGTYFRSAPPVSVDAVAHDKSESDSGSVDDTPLYFYSLPLHRNERAAGSLLVIYDTGSLDLRGLRPLSDSILTALLAPLLTTGTALVSVRREVTDALT